MSPRPEEAIRMIGRVSPEAPPLASRRQYKAPHSRVAGTLLTERKDRTRRTKSLPILADCCVSLPTCDKFAVLFLLGNSAANRDCL